MLLRVEGLPEGALDAAAHFHAEVLPRLRGQAGAAGESLILVFPPAGHEHRGWRLAAVQGLARAWAPRRVNAVEAVDEAAIAAAVRYLDRAPGVTGHCLALDGLGAGEVLPSLP